MNNSDSSIGDVIISLPKGDDEINFNGLGSDFDHDIELMHAIFQDMDMSNVTMPNDYAVLRSATFNNVSGVQHIINQTIFQNNPIYNEGLINAKFINIKEPLDFSKVNVEFATFKDMDMSKVKTKDGEHSFTSAIFDHVINLDLTNKKFKTATFENINGATGRDCSKIPGHPYFTN